MFERVEVPGVGSEEGPAWFATPFEAGAGGDDAALVSRQELMVARLTSTGIDKYSACISSWTLLHLDCGFSPSAAIE